MKKMTVLAAACLMTAALCAGTVRAEEDLKIIGVKEEGATQIALTNATGRDISEFRIRSTEETEFSDNMLEEGDVFETDETRFFFYVWPEEEEQEFTEEDFAEADAQDGTQEDLPDDKELTVGYDIQITFADDESTAEVNAFLNYYDGQLVGNLIIDRQVLNNMYNTLCLPFDMDADQIAASSLNGVEIYEFVDATVSNDELYLFTSEEKHEVVAGRPYLVKYSAALQLDDLDFVDVVVNNADLEAQKVVHDGVTFKGTFAPYWMEQQTGLNYEGGYLFLGQNNTLFWPGVSNYVKPFRAYFYVDITTANHNGMPIRRGMPARIGEPHNMPTGVESIQHSDISGQKIMIDGVLYIIRGEHMYDAQGQLVK